MYIAPMVVRIEVYIQCGVAEKTQGTEKFIYLTICLIDGIIFAPAINGDAPNIRFDKNIEQLIQVDNASFYWTVSTVSYYPKVS